MAQVVFCALILLVTFSTAAKNLHEGELVTWHNGTENVTTFDPMKSTFATADTSGRRDVTSTWYIPYVAVNVATREIVGSWFTFLILLNNMVPISLYVSMELVKVPSP